MDNYGVAFGDDFKSFPKEIPQLPIPRLTLELTYKQELIFAVMSRMLFCSSVSPFCSFCST